ncbi:MAG: amino acid permease, partial [Actinomycetota bacterium]|nr:amino acid permease [Actinomycetota bacterium]
NLVAVIEIAVISVYFILPFVPQGVPFSSNFSWKFVNYAPILTGGALLLLLIWWKTSARSWFTGPKHTIDEAVVQAFDEG